MNDSRKGAKYIKRKSRKASAYNRAVTQTNRAKIRIIAHMAFFDTPSYRNTFTNNPLPYHQGR